jgi:hypothetical protein
MQRTMERLIAAVEHLTYAVQQLPQPRVWSASPGQARPQPPRHMEQAADAPQERATAGPSPAILGVYDPAAAAARMQELRQQGLSHDSIADRLTTEGYATRYGRPWQGSSVRHLLRTYGREQGGA